MKSTILTLLAIALSAVGLFAQSRSFGSPSMIPQSSLDQGTEKEKLEKTPAYKKALKVYERLREARGDFRYPVPTFKMTGKNIVAVISYGANEILLGEKAFMVCDSFGEKSEAALAFLLGHELTHYYEKHAWRKSFASANSNLSISKQLDSLYHGMLDSTKNKEMRDNLLRFDTLSHRFEEVAMEAQSDYLGGFLAYSAGYGMFDEGPELIRRLYRAFELKDTMEGYVTRTEREAMCLRSSERMKSLVEVFEMANLLTIIGSYQEAFQYYRYVLLEYQSREVYNNVGAAAMLSAIRLLSAADLKYRYPVQLDLDVVGIKLGDATERNMLLEQAIQYFDAAISLDPDYAPAYLNKACAYAMLGDSVRARFYADVEARKAAGQGKFAKTVGDIEILLGILDTKNGDTTAAKKHFETALASSKDLAEYNLAVLEGKPVPGRPTAPPTSNKGEEIDGQKIARIQFPEEVPEKKLFIGTKLTFHQNPEQGKNSHLFFSRLSGKMTLFLVTNPGYPGETGGAIRLGASRKNITDAYGGEPSQSIQAPNGEIMVYPDLSIIFIMKEGKLDRWALYKLPR